MADVVIFAPSPVLSITIEEHPDGGDVHVHAGGQGVWQARMLLAMGCSVELCSVLSGETGMVQGFLLREEGIGVAALTRKNRGSVYVHDRRGGERIEIIESGGDALTRHELDELYGLTLRHALDAKLVILSGPGPAGNGIVPADFYRRLAADLGTGGVRVLVDLAGDRLNAALAGGVDLVKVSDEELLEDGRIEEAEDEDIIHAMRAIRGEGAKVVIVTRADKPSLLWDADGLCEIAAPKMEVVDPKGAGDSFVGALAAVLARGGTVHEAARMGAAAGAQNVTRHGLGTGDAKTIERILELVELHPRDDVAPPAREVTPDDLAARVVQS